MNASLSQILLHQSTKGLEQKGKTAGPSRLMVVSHEANKKEHACMFSGPYDHYSELLTRMAALKFENAVSQPP